MSQDLGRIQANQLAKKFGKIEAVSGVNLDVEPGEIYGLIGPDGAGKTTTIRMLAGVMKPSAGIARVNGFDTNREAEKLRHEVGYMAQRFTLYGDLSVKENVEFFADVFSVPHEHRTERINRALEFSRLDKFTDRDAGVLSGGQKKKLGLACALIQRPKVLFLDEPTNGVDPVSRREFWDILSDLHIRGVTIFVSTAYMDEAERCSRVGLMYKGKIISEGKPSELRQLVRGELLAVATPDLQAAESATKTLDGVFEVQIYGDRLHVFVDHAATRESQIGNALTAQGIRVGDIRRTDPRLEEVFISLVTHQNQR